MYRVIIFGGTTEGRKLAEFFNRQKVKTCVCVATSYGASLLPQGQWLTISHKPLDQLEMEEMFRSYKPELVVDSTHPYAKEVTQNIRKACENCGLAYFRLLREGTAGKIKGTDADAVADDTRNGTKARAEEMGDAIFVDSLDEAIDYLAEREGKILAATGSKELHKYTRLEGYRERVVARVLSTDQVAAQCHELGFTGKNLICMQGPFSKEMNQATLQQYGCKYLVTKASGTTGGYEDKIEAALELGCTPIIIGRPEETTGMPYFLCKEQVCKKLGLETVRQIKLVGIGMGDPMLMTSEAEQAVSSAELIVGASRMVKAVAKGGQATFVAYDTEKIVEYISSHPEYEAVAVVFSGDIGFYSGAKKLTIALQRPEHREQYQISYVPGISSLSYFVGRLGKTWEDAVIVSNHGTDMSLIPLIRDNSKVFSILGKRDSIRQLAGKLKEYGLTEARIFVGEQLSYSEEKIQEGVADDFLDYENDPLAVVLVENPQVLQTAINPLRVRRDDEFLRDKVPMTKEEVRCISLSKLALTPDAVCYDVGAGTGSVAIEMAIRATKGRVYAVEKKAEAVALIEKNKKKFMADNLHIVDGLAPDALTDLPKPTHVFVGGSSGNMTEILETVFAKNPKARVVINCIALESVAEAVSCAEKFSCGDEEIIQVAVSKGRKVATYTMMTGENPITIVAFTGKGGGTDETA